MPPTKYVNNVNSSDTVSVKTPTGDRERDEVLFGERWGWVSLKSNA